MKKIIMNTFLLSSLRFIWPLTTRRFRFALKKKKIFDIIFFEQFYKKGYELYDPWKRKENHFSLKKIINICNNESFDEKGTFLNFNVNFYLFNFFNSIFIFLSVCNIWSVDCNRWLYLLLGLFYFVVKHFEKCLNWKDIKKFLM